METTTLTEFESNLAEYVDKVQKGEGLIVTKGTNEKKSSAYCQYQKKK